MGIVFEPMVDPHNPSQQRGVRICDLPRTGAAAMSQKLELGDELLSINDKTMSRLTFDEIMDFIIEADKERVDLLFRRPNRGKDKDGPGAVGAAANANAKGAGGLAVIAPGGGVGGGAGAGGGAGRRRRRRPAAVAHGTRGSGFEFEFRQVGRREERHGGEADGGGPRRP
jgi:hypothetical protein